MLDKSARPEEQVIKELKAARKATDKYSCNVEVIMKDNHTMGNNPDNVINRVKIAKKEFEAF